jgi:NNP family nitrate/nitrite transporter-like MFS transporter
MVGWDGRARALHLSWIGFFATFVVWFDFAPFSATIGRQLHLSAAQLAAIGLCNLGLTVPARMAIGAALDRFGPRRVFPCILIGAAVPNTVFALATSFPALVLSRLALSVVGAGFVVGIRMVREWWPDAELGTAEGVYAGWGNFGSGVATVGLPVLADALGGAHGWRWSIGACGLVSAAWGVVYLWAARNTPDGTAWVRPRRQGALEVTSRPAAIGLVLLTMPVVGVLGIVAYRLYLVHVIDARALAICVVVLVVLVAVQAAQVLRVNRPALAGDYPTREQYPFRAVVLCCLVYAVTFGGELAVLSTLPTFFGATWHLGVATAGIAAGTFGLMNLVTRPVGGLLSDRTGRRRRTLVVLLTGTAVCFCLMSLLHEDWPVVGAVVLGIGAAAFLQASNGAVFAVAPQIDRRVSGQIAGLVGAYGNLGGIVWLFLLVYVAPQTMFLGIGLAAVAIGLVVGQLLPEPVAVPGPAGPQRMARAEVTQGASGVEPAVPMPDPGDLEPVLR